MKLTELITSTNKSFSTIIISVSQWMAVIMTV